MSDQPITPAVAHRRNWMADHRLKYLRSGGAEGHIEDMTELGGLSFGTHLLLKYRGRKSGKTFITPLCYGDMAGEAMIIGSKGGSDEHPAWYLNIRAAPDVEFQIATQAFRGTWREPEGAERERIWQFMVAGYPFYAAYRLATSREIPVLALKAFEPIPVFTESDATGERNFG